MYIGVSLHHDQPHDLIVSGSEDCSVCIWHMDDPGAHVKRLHHTSPINCVAIQRNIVVAASNDDTAAVWNFELVTNWPFRHLINRMHCGRLALVQISIVYHAVICTKAISQCIQFMKSRNGL